MTSLYPQLPILMVDDEMQTLNSFDFVLRSASMNHSIRCQDSRKVMAIFSEQEIEVMLLDLSMPYVSGEELLSMVTKDFPEVPIIVITGSNDVETAVRCMKSGAFDYMVKPVEKSRLISGVKRAIEIRELQRENKWLRAHVLSDRLEHPDVFSEIITNSPAMQSIFQYIEAISSSPQPVLITGETGVGKELVAKAIHRLSDRTGPFVPVNVAGLDDNVFADTLFGHRKGAFTGADQTRGGMVEQASGGTLFLDEIGDLSPASQVKLLRLSQDGEFFPLGSDVAKRSDARVLGATNQDLETAPVHGQVSEGSLLQALCPSCSSSSSARTTGGLIPPHRLFPGNGVPNPREEETHPAHGTLYPPFNLSFPWQCQRIAIDDIGRCKQSSIRETFSGGFQILYSSKASCL